MRSLTRSKAPRQRQIWRRLPNRSLVVLTTAPVRDVIFQLFGLGPLTVLAAISRVLALVAIGKHHIVADQVILNVRHGARSGAFSLRSRSQTLAVSMCSTCHDLSLRFLGLVARLSRMIMLIVLAFLVYTAATYGKFRLASAALGDLGPRI